MDQKVSYRARMLKSVTVTLLTYNDEQILPQCLESIKKQDYKGKVEVLLVDGGSTDKTLSIAKTYGAKVMSRPDLADSPPQRLHIGVNSVKSDIVILFSADNRFQEDNCLSDMIQPFENDEISIVQTFKYGFFPESSVLTKYFALIGGADPIAVALGKADRAPYDTQKWLSFGKATEYRNHFVVEFTSDPLKLPTLGANGIAVRNSVLKKYPMDSGLHTEMCINFIRHGYNKFAFTKNTHIVHEIYADLISFCRRRLRWATLYSSKRVTRGYQVFNFPHDVGRLLLTVIFSFTFIVPLLRAVKGFVVYPHLAWFLHPIILFVFVLTYGIQVVWSAVNALKS